MRSLKSLVAASVVIGGAVAGTLAVASPAMAAQKTCTVGRFVNSCNTGTLPSSATRAVTICGKASSTATAYAMGFDADTGVQVGRVSVGRTLKCTDIGGLYGTRYYTKMFGAPGSIGYISN